MSPMIMMQPRDGSFKTKFNKFISLHKNVAMFDRITAKMIFLSGSLKGKC